MQRYGYHERQPAWRNYRGNGKRIGIELEVRHPGGYRRLLENFPVPGANDLAPIAEEDGSLGERTGVEIVFPPITPDQIRLPTGYFAKVIDHLGKAGAKGGTGYGMHMNVNIGGWSEGKSSAFCATINLLPDATILRLGGRKPGRYRNRIHVLDSIREYRWDSGYGLAEWSGTRIECRFPASTVDKNKIDLLVEFLDALEKVSAIEAFQKELDFILENERGRAVDVYRRVQDSLVKYLRKKKINASAKLLEVITGEAASEDPRAAPAEAQ